MIRDTAIASAQRQQDSRNPLACGRVVAFLLLATGVAFGSPAAAQQPNADRPDLLADLESVLPTETELAQATQGGRDWGRHVYAMFSLVLVLMVSLYVRMIDDALAKAIDRSGEAQIYHRSMLMDQNHHGQTLPVVYRRDQ